MLPRQLIGGASARTFFFTRITDEAKALARKGTDETLLLTVIVEGVSGSIDASA